MSCLGGVFERRPSDHGSNRARTGEARGRSNVGKRLKRAAQRRLVADHVDVTAYVAEEIDR